METAAIVSELTLGTMTFGAEADEPTSHQILDTFVEHGGTFIDTADVYTAGTSETIIGHWLRDHPEEAKQVVLATKGRFPMGEGPNDVGLSRRHLRIALDASLTRLGVDHIDLYQMHAWDALTPIDETLTFLNDAVTAGKIGYYGFSNYLGWQLTKAVHRAVALHLAPPVTLQPQYSLLVRDIEHEVVPASLDAGIGLLPWSPLGGGWLTGKYVRDQAPTGASRLGENPEQGMEAWAARNGDERTFAAVFVRGALQRVAGMGFAMVVAPFSLLLPSGQQGVVFANICGAAAGPVRRDIEWRRFGLLAASGVVGAVIGAFIVGALDAAVFRINVGSVLIVAIIASLVAGRLRYSASVTPASLAAGGGTGMLVTMSRIGGAPMSIYAIVTRWDRRAFATTMQPFVVVSSLIGAAAVLNTSPGAFPELSAPMWCGIALAVATGFGIGQFVNRFVSRRLGRVVVIALGLIGAVIAIAAGVSAL